MGHHGSDRISAARATTSSGATGTRTATRRGSATCCAAAPATTGSTPATGATTVDAGPGRDYVWAFYGRGTIDCGAGRDTVRVRLGGAFRLKRCEVVNHFCAFGNDGHGGCKQPGTRSARRAAARGRRLGAQPPSSQRANASPPTSGTQRRGTANGSPARPGADLHRAREARVADDRAGRRVPRLARRRRTGRRTPSGGRAGPALEVVAAALDLGALLVARWRSAGSDACASGRRASRGGPARAAPRRSAGDRPAGASRASSARSISPGGPRLQPGRQVRPSGGTEHPGAVPDLRRAPRRASRQARRHAIPPERRGPPPRDPC